jgi:probable rRNA maturation factor
VSIRIAITDQQDILRVDRRRLRAVAVRTLREEGVRHAEVGLVLLDDPQIHLLNRRHLDHDYPTDVLSFLLSDHALAGGVQTQGDGPRMEGELILSTETAQRRAKEFQWSAHDELTLYVVHGLLHLCGYDDHSAIDRRRMRARERTHLNFWGLDPHYSSRSRR